MRTCVSENLSCLPPARSLVPSVEPAVGYRWQLGGAGRGWSGSLWLLVCSQLGDTLLPLWTQDQSVFSNYFGCTNCSFIGCTKWVPSHSGSAHPGHRTRLCDHTHLRKRNNSPEGSLQPLQKEQWCVHKGLLALTWSWVGSVTCWSPPSLSAVFSFWKGHHHILLCQAWCQRLERQRWAGQT